MIDEPTTNADPLRLGSRRQIGDGIVLPGALHCERGQSQRQHARRLFLAAVVVFSPASLDALAGASIYYVSGTGDDGLSGTDPSSAWRTITRVNQQVLQPGDKVFFEGGSLFPGTLVLAGSESGTSLAPITFASYGVGSGEVWAKNDTGFDMYNVSGIRITNLIVTGSGRNTNNGIGISFYADLPGDVKLPWIRIDHCRVRGFRRGGISIGSWAGRTGFENIRVTQNQLDQNGNNGMAVWGQYGTDWGQTLQDYPHRSIYIARNVFESNWGDPLRRTRSTGSGCEVSQAARVLIEYNEAFDNGRLNSFSGGGPIGIWMWDVLQGVIQYNESHHNSSGTLDGGGFDLDGGCVDSWMQYNYSHDNDGTGFLIAQFPNGARPMRDVTVRYNVSERDGGRGSAAALQLWNGDSAGPPIREAVFHNNTVFVETKPLGITRGFRVFGGGGFVSSGFANNIFHSRGSSAWVGESVSAGIWLGNLYFAEAAPFVIRQGGVAYSSLDAWRTATGHELFGGPTGFQADPQLNAPGDGGTIGDPMALETLLAYQLQPASPFKDAGFPLQAYGIPLGPTDYFGIPLVQGPNVSIGAHEGL